MPTKNSDLTVLESIESVYKQTYKATELIIVDESSTDSTIPLIQENFPNVKIIQNYFNGAQGALSIAIPQVKTEFISFLDSDDIWASEKSQLQINFLNNQPDIDVVSSGISNFSEQIRNNEKIKYVKDFGATRLFTASMFRTDIFNRVGLPSRSVNHFVWQIDWWIRANSFGIKTGYIDNIHLFRRIHNRNSWVLDKATGVKSILEITREHIQKMESS